ncbi:hypothetical protein NLX83_37945 [Allokutzneria sp. A3M-2-11 16]|uniref:hypothetical protein n=1 Tax=Allokutzneria sp. A3M-2-11 16 TaxID=2962043 RepID=UPI0020B73B1F|nr:hypothetical protein [Allokutzneria sp. A3M-2-11 16]MCP3805065.1 hypothetical protein [Allokutzneria sp. A3M-2-11 16]
MSSHDFREWPAPDHAHRPDQLCSCSLEFLKRAPALEHSAAERHALRIYARLHTELLGRGWSKLGEEVPDPLTELSEPGVLWAHPALPAWAELDDTGLLQPQLPSCALHSDHADDLVVELTFAGNWDGCDQHRALSLRMSAEFEPRWLRVVLDEVEATARSADVSALQTCATTGACRVAAAARARELTAWSRWITATPEDDPDPGHPAP